MYASIRRYRTKMGVEVTRRVKEGFVPLISQDKGFIAYYVVDGGKGEWASISIFETKEEAELSNLQAAEWVRKSNTAPLMGTPEITAGEIVVQQGK